MWNINVSSFIVAAKRTGNLIIADPAYFFKYIFCRQLSYFLLFFVLIETG